MTSLSHKTHSRHLHTVPDSLIWYKCTFQTTITVVVLTVNTPLVTFLHGSETVCDAPVWTAWSSFADLFFLLGLFFLVNLILPNKAADYNDLYSVRFVLF